MKLTKVFSIIALSAMTLVANAAVNSVQINITGETGAAEGTLNIAQTSGVCVDFEMVTDGNPINVWAIVGSKKYSTYQTAGEINGTAIGFKGNTNTNYTMTFNCVGGTVKIYDAVKDSIIVPVENGTYEFTCAANTEITDRFRIGEPVKTYTRTVTSGNWATMCYPDSITAVEGADIYQIVAINSAKTKVAVEVVNVLNMKPGKAYLFNATADAQTFTYFPDKTVADSIQNNGLIGTFKGIKLAEEKWVLTDNTITPAAVGSTVGQYRCYIDLELTPEDDTKFVAGVPGRRIFNVTGGQTDLENVNANVNANRKMMIDGKLVIVKDGKMFNAQGQEL